MYYQNKKTHIEGNVILKSVLNAMETKNDTEFESQMKKMTVVIPEHKEVYLSKKELINKKI